MVLTDAYRELFNEVNRIYPILLVSLNPPKLGIARIISARNDVTTIEKREYRVQGCPPL